MPCLVVRSGPSWSTRAVLLEPVEGDLEPSHPIAVTFPASSEAIDALLGTMRGSPRVVPDETKLAITKCASRGTAKSKIIGAMGIVVSSSYYRRCSSIILFHPRTAWAGALFLRVQPRTIAVSLAITAGILLSPTLQIDRSSLAAKDHRRKAAAAA